MRVLVAAAVFALTGCGDLVGFGGEVTPLVRVRAQTTGSAPEPIHHLRIGLMWAEQSLPEAFCIARSCGGDRGGLFRSAAFRRRAHAGERRRDAR